MINALLSINVNQIERFYDNWRFRPDLEEIAQRVRTDFAPYQTNATTPLIDVYNVKDFQIIEDLELWKDRQQGPNNFRLVSCYVADKTELDWTDPQDPDPKEILTIVHYLRETFPGVIKVLDCFKMDGIRHGQTLAEDGITVTGQPTYPPVGKNEMLDYMPDDIDPPGPATNYKQINLIAGQKTRRYE